MKEKQLLLALNLIDEKYIMEAMPKTFAGSKGMEQKKSRKRHTTYPVKKLLAALVLVILICTLFLQTPAGAKAAEIMQRQMEKIIEILFPAKELTVTMEGFIEKIPHTVLGEDPDVASPGFAIYVDPDRYFMLKEEDAYYIRPMENTISREEIRNNNAVLLEGLSAEEQEKIIDRRIEELEVFYDSLPDCEIVIRKVDNLSSWHMAKKIYDEKMAEGWESLSEIAFNRQLSCIAFALSAGTLWDSMQEEHYFYDDQQGGAYHVILKFYLEATEGHGARFHAMLETFTVVNSDEAN